MDTNIPFILKYGFENIKIDVENKTHVSATCKKCSKTLKGSLNATTNFLNHLKTRNHGHMLADYEKLKTESVNKKRKHDNVVVTGEWSTSTKMLKQSKLTVIPKSINFDKLLVSFLVNTISPISIVEDSSFKALIEGAQQLTVPPTIMCRQTCNKRISETYSNYLETIKQTLKKVDFVCTTADIWSSSRRSYLGVTVYWIDCETLDRKSATLACRRFRGAHTYEKVTELIMEIHSEFDLTPTKIVKTVTDNGSNMLKAFKLFGQRSDSGESFDVVEDVVGEETDNEDDDVLQVIHFPESVEELEQIQLPYLTLIASMDINKARKTMFDSLMIVVLVNEKDRFWVNMQVISNMDQTQIYFWLIPLLFACFGNFYSHAFVKRSGTNSVYYTNYTELTRAVRNSLLDVEQRQKWHQQHPRSRRAIKRVCYAELGCFEDSGPFAYLEMLPSPPEEINTKFYFYSTRNRSDRPLMELPFINMTTAFQSKRGQAIRSIAEMSGSTVHTAKENMLTLKKQTMTIHDIEGFDELSVRIIVHGFGSACPHVWIYEMKTALMAVEDCIVICVNWENGATFPNYVRAAANTRLVGKQLAMLIKNLQTHKGLNLTRTHIIGFSLGAHVSGFAGAELPGLSRITGLDPAGPLFESQHPKVRLDSTDADFVDVIHSNGENLILGGLGSWQPMGHVDYYPNGGRVQTGCSNLFVGAVTDFIWSAQATEDEEGRSLCNHRRAYKFFIDSVAPRCMFPAFPCANYDDFLKGNCFPCAQDDQDIADGIPRCGNMGYYADRSNGRGQLYLVTREEEPFCAHQFQLRIFNSFNDLPLRTIGRLEVILQGDGGLNETLQISEKDDSELFAGDIISKIIVPHPALGFPTTISLLYKSYSGWLSKGLPHLDIDKVVLTDSFGRSHSLCNPSTKLSSGIPVRMKLQPGNCELENQDDYGAYTTTIPTSTDVPDSSGQESSIVSGITVTATSDDIEDIKQSKDVFNLGTSFKLTENQTYPLEQTDQLPWQPILEGNSLDKEVSESSRSLSAVEATEIFEPILKDRRNGNNRGRNLQDFVTTEEIVEPLLKATTSRIKNLKEIIPTDAAYPSQTTSLPELMNFSRKLNTDNRSGKSALLTPTSPVGETMTIQLLPFRLGELLQRAERYARETLLPLISVQAPRFLGFNVTPHNIETRSESRKPRYIPRYEEATFLATNRQNRSQVRYQSDEKAKVEEAKKFVSYKSPSQHRNPFKVVRTDVPVEHRLKKNQIGLKQETGTAKVASPETEFAYYTNALRTESRSLKPEDPGYEPVFIDLPTYKPPKMMLLRP